MMNYTEIFKAYGVDISQRNDVQPTAEGLRAAAKVLEEKATELDKPKLSEARLRTLEVAKETGFDIYDFQVGGKYTKIATMDGCTTNIGDSLWGYSYKMESTLMSKFFYYGGYNYTVKVFKDEDGDVCVGLSWPA